MTAPTPGVPNWVDLGTADLEDAKRFYSGLFGWDAYVSPEPESGGYTTFLLDGRPVAGAGPLFGEAQPTAWSTYIATTDSDTIATRVEAAGGRVLVAPFDVPGALTWNELTTRDVEGSKKFYGAVFGWAARDSSVAGLPYVIWEHGGQTIAGMQPMIGNEWPDDLPPHWMVYFAVADCDDSAGLAQHLGGRVINPPTSFPMGRYAVIEDPQGGVFSILAAAR